MAKDSRKGTSEKPLKKGGLGPFKISDESHPIFSRPTTIGFGSPMGPLTPKPKRGPSLPRRSGQRLGRSSGNRDAEQD